MPWITTAPPPANVSPTTRLAKIGTSSPSQIPTFLPTTKPSTATRTPTVKPTDLPSITPTVPPAARLDFQCLEEIVPDLPMAGTYTGTVVLGGYTDTLSYQLDLYTWIMKPLVEEHDEKSLGETVSPDRKWLAYEPYTTNEFIVTTINGEEDSIHIPREDNWEYLKGWLDNQNLQIYIEGGLIGADWWHVSYNPSLTRAVYPSHPGIVNANGQYGEIILWDMQTNQAITSLSSKNNPYGGEPVWSPIGDEFIMTLQDIDLSKDTLFDELYLVSQDGQQTRISNLSVYYTKLLAIKKYRLSPDASRIAFWLRYGWVEYFDKNQLAILDLETLQVTNYCIDGAMGDNYPVWSPDGRQLIVEGRIDKDHIGTILVDLDKKIAFRIAGYFRPVGWMVSP
jgi:WD40 repeat protein